MCNWYYDLRTRLLTAGFGEVGVTPVVSPEPPDTQARIREWVARGYHGPLGYLVREDALQVRLDVRQRWPWVRSVVAAVFPYNTLFGPGDVTQLADGAKVSRYAHGIDYHEVLPHLLKRACRGTVEAHPGTQLRYYTDTGPVLERAWAARAGLGFVGKNGLLITRRWGSWVFLSVVLSSEPVPTGEEPRPVPSGCGTCTLCLDACPAGAIPEPHVLDARRCASALTLEFRGALPPEAPEWLDGWALGCDACQQVCPWNRRVERTTDAHFAPAPDLADLTLAGLTAWPEPRFRDRFRETVFWRPRQVQLRHTRDAIARPDAENK